MQVPKLTARRVVRRDLPTAVLSLDARTDGSRVYAACMDGVYELNPETGEHRRLYGHESYASGVALLEGSGQLVSAGYDGALCWFDLAGQKLLRRVEAHRFWSWQMSVSPDGKHVASVTGQYLAGTYKYEPAPETEPCVRVYNSATGRLEHSFSHVPSVQSVAFSPDSRYVAAGNLMGELRVYDLQQGKQVASWRSESFTSWGIIKSHCYLGGIFGLAFAPDGETILASGMGPMADPMAGNGKQLWQRFAWKENPPRKVAETRPGDQGEGLMEALAIHPGGEWFVMSGRLRGGSWNTGLFSLADGSLIHSFKTDSRITRARFTAGGSRLLLGGTRSQPGLKDGKQPSFGHVDVFEVAAS